MLKLRPFENYIGNDPVYLYVGIRADEPHRSGYISTKSNIIARFPFVEDGIKYSDVKRLLDGSGLGLPEYYKWRSRSGCYFCFFQQRREWVGLLENHPDLFRKAAGFEKTDAVSGMHFTWIENESLLDLEKPDRVEQIKADYQKKMSQVVSFRKDAALMDVFSSDGIDGGGCLICHL